jgi:hypothetical protein
MANAPVNGLIQHFRRAALLQGAAGMSDGQLLERYLSRAGNAEAQIAVSFGSVQEFHARSVAQKNPAFLVRDSAHSLTHESKPKQQASPVKPVNLREGHTPLFLRVHFRRLLTAMPAVMMVVIVAMVLVRLMRPMNHHIIPNIFMCGVRVSS